MLDKFKDIIVAGGLPLVLLLLFFEGNPFVGNFIPGQTIVFIVGFLIASTGLFEVHWALLVIFFGGFLGDLFGYFLGYRIVNLKTFLNSRKNDKSFLNYANDFFNKYGSWSVILGREVNFTRSFIPFFAGMSKMNFGKFFLLAALSNILWTIISFYLGFYLGFLVIEKFEFIFEFLVLLLIYFIIIYFVYASFRNFFSKNLVLLRDYAIHNMIYLGFLLSGIIILLFAYQWGYSVIINEYFILFFYPGIGQFFSFFVSFNFVIFLIFVLLLFIIYKRDFRHFLIFLWILIFSIFFNISFGVLLKRWFDILPYITVILITILVFFAYVLLNRFRVNYKMRLIFNSILFFLIFFHLILKFSLTQNFFMVLLSFFIAAFECEILVILSHYRIIDKEISIAMNRDVIINDILRIKFFGKKK